MRGLRLERPPVWGILTLALLLLGNVALFTLMGMRPAPADTYESQAPAGAGAAAPQSPAAAPAPEAAPTEPPVLAVYGDGYAAGNEMGGRGAAGWPALVAEETGTTLVLNAVPQAGYASVGVTGEDYLELLSASPVPDADVTLLFGSRNDADQDLGQVQSQVVSAMAVARENAPQAALVVIGPVWDDGNAPASVLAVRDLVQAAAEEAGALFVDPLAEGWFSAGSGLISTDGISPTDAGHAHLAELIAPTVTAAVR